MSLSLHFVWHNVSVSTVIPHQAGPSWRGSIYSQILLWCLRHSPSRGWNSNYRWTEPQSRPPRRSSTQWPESNRSKSSHLNTTRSNRSPHTSPLFAASCCQLHTTEERNRSWQIYGTRDPELLWGFKPTWNKITWGYASLEESFPLSWYLHPQCFLRRIAASNW